MKEDIGRRVRVVGDEVGRVALEGDESALAALDAKLTEAMKTVFGGVVRWAGGSQPVRFNISYNPTLKATRSIPSKPA